MHSKFNNGLYNVSKSHQFSIESGRPSDRTHHSPYKYQRNAISTGIYISKFVCVLETEDFNIEFFLDGWGLTNIYLHLAHSTYTFAYVYSIHK